MKDLNKSTSIAFFYFKNLTASKAICFLLTFFSLPARIFLVVFLYSPYPCSENMSHDSSVSICLFFYFIKKGLFDI